MTDHLTSKGMVYVRSNAVHTYIFDHNGHYLTRVPKGQFNAWWRRNGKPLWGYMAELEAELV